MSALKQFRTMTGPERRKAMRDHLTKAHAVDFSADVHAVPISALNACADMAKAVCWRKSISSSMSTGAAFFVYLAREVQPIVKKVGARQGAMQINHADLRRLALRLEESRP